MKVLLKLRFIQRDGLIHSAAGTFLQRPLDPSTLKTADLLMIHLRPRLARGGETTIPHSKCYPATITIFVTQFSTFAAIYNSVSISKLQSPQNSRISPYDLLSLKPPSPSQLAFSQAACPLRLLLSPCDQNGSPAR